MNLATVPGLADFVLRPTIVLLLAALIGLAARRLSASTRHLVWSAALVACLVVPFVGNAVPRLAVPTGDRVAALFAEAPSPALVRPSGSEESRPVAAQAEGAATPGSPAMAIRWRIVWLVGCAGFLGLLTFRLVSLRGVEGRAHEAGRPELRAALAAAMARLGIDRPVRLLLGDPSAMPMTWGLRRPRILLPEAAIEWPPEQTEAVLLHELAHVRRGDVALQRLAEVARAVFWFNPLIWYASWRMLVEREHACDDAVLTSGVRGSEYAHQLLAMAHSLRTSGVSAALPMARRSQMTGRLLAILDERRPRGAPVAGPAAAVALGLAIALGAAALRPTSASAGSAEVGGPGPAATEALARADTEPAAASTCWRDGNSNSNKNHDPGLITAEVRTTRCFIFLRISGYAILRPDSAAFSWLEPGGRVTIRETQGNTTRTLELVGGSGGEVVRSGTRDGLAIDNAEVSDWLQENLGPLIRRTGVELEVGGGP